MGTAINQKAYLQKYLSGPSGDKKKKKKKAIKGSGLKIIDDDIDLSKLRTLEGDELDVFDQGEDAPQIVGIIDDRPEEVKKAEQFSSSTKWKVINQDDGFNSKIEIEEIKRDIKQAEKENELIFGKMYSDSEDDKEIHNSDPSPLRKQDSDKAKASKKHDSDSDFSPPRKRDARSPKISPDKSPSRKHTNRSPSRHENTKRSNDKSLKRRSPNKSPKRSYNKSPSSHNKSPRRKIHERSYDKSPRRSIDKSPKRKNYEKTSTRNYDRSPREKGKERVRKPSRWGDFGPDIPSLPSQTEDTPKVNSMPGRKTRRDSPRKSKNYDSDASPPRKSKKNYDSDLSPPRTSKTNDDSDASPPRKSKGDSRQRKESPGNMSPKRDERKKHSPHRQSQNKRHEKSRKQKYSSDSDLSPPRKHRQRSPSPIRKHKKQDNSKRKYNSDSDQSPPRVDRERNNSDRNRKRGDDSPPPSNKKMAKTLEGKMAGLQDARQLRQENESFRRKEDEVFNKMSDEVSGRNAQVVSRKLKRETSEDRQKQKEKADRQRELDEKYKKWSKGIKQLEEQEARVQEFMHESSKPLARLRDDKDLEDSLRQLERDGDPMLQYMRDRKRERGELGPEKPVYKGNFPPNRFGIRPGYRWDGVDRSNGYEKKFFEQQSKRKAQEEEAYKWSTEDL